MNDPMQQPDLKVQDVKLEDIYGTFPMIDTAPTWTPKKFIDAFAFYHNGATYRLYVYDFEGAAWRYCSLT